MSSRISKSFVAAVLALWLVVIYPAPSTRAQETAKPESHTPAAQSQENAQVPAEVKDEEKKSGSETDWVKQSGAVKWVAKAAGLTLDQAYWLCFGINFAIVLVAIVVFMRKKLPGAFRARTAGIKRGIEEAQKASAEARQRLDEVEARLSRIDADIAAMRAEAEENAKAEERRIQTSTEDERRRIVASAEQEIALAASAARRELKSYAAELAVDLAEKRIRVDKHADEALVREFSAQLGKDGN